MHDALITKIENPGPLTISARWKQIWIALAVIGALGLTAGVVMTPARAWHGFLVGYFVTVGLSLFGLFFTALHHAVNATWMISLRRIAEGLTAFLPVALILFIGIIVGANRVYPWMQGEVFADPLKQKWLSLPFFAARGIIYLLLWILFAWRIVGQSLKQDQTGDPDISRKLKRCSIVFLPVFAITFSLASFDWIMSLQPRWTSTLFAVYCFAGIFQSGLALLMVLLISLRKKGILSAVTTPSQVKDVGTFVFAFTIFMAYIGFSQYMLIWYANLPEETGFFLLRQHGGWLALFIALPLFKFIIPFFGLLSQSLKKSESWTIIPCASILVGQYLDFYWLVMPTLSKDFLAIGWMELASLALCVGLFAMAVSRFYGKNSLIAVNDPRILTSVNWRFWE